MDILMIRLRSETVRKKVMVGRSPVLELEGREERST